MTIKKVNVIVLEPAPAGRTEIHLRLDDQSSVFYSDHETWEIARNNALELSMVFKVDIVANMVDNFKNDDEKLTLGKILTKGDQLRYRHLILHFPAPKQLGKEVISIKISPLVLKNDKKLEQRSGSNHHTCGYDVRLRLEDNTCWKLSEHETEEDATSIVSELHKEFNLPVEMYAWQEALVEKTEHPEEIVSAPEEKVCNCPACDLKRVMLEALSSLKNETAETVDRIDIYKRLLKLPIPGKKYIVKSGDTLSDIALRAYGNPDYWEILFLVNGDIISDPNVIYPDQVIQIPEIIRLDQ
jgi:hypothetical protein